MAGPVPQQGTFQGSKAKKAQARSDAGAAGKPGRGVARGS